MGHNPVIIEPYVSIMDPKIIYGAPESMIIYQTL